jgi:drug/metabolite transporter (DMT)-like permease
MVVSDDPPMWLVYMGLFFAMCTCSSAAVVFTHLTDQMGVPPALCASWRLAWVDLIQFLPFILTLRKVRRQDRERELVQHWELEGIALREEDPKDEPTEVQLNLEAPLLPRIFGALPLIILSGSCLGVHFSSWTYSLRETSLTHSLLWVSMGPIIINGGSWIAYLLGYNTRSPSFIESGGTLIGLSGALIMLLDVRGGISEAGAPSLVGDLVALFGAAAVSVYLVVGRHLRAWMPLWIYAFGVVGIAYATCLVLAFGFGELDAGFSIYGMFQHPYVWYALYLGAGPGIAGHTLLNYLVKYVSPLTIATAMLSEPLFGSYLGYLAGMQPIPGLYTWLGGVVLLVGLFAILYGETENDDKIEEL